jgi:hypothetical protein
MADTAQVIYEHTNGNTKSIFPDTFKIDFTRPTLKFFVRPDNKIYVQDSDVSQRIIYCTGEIAGADIEGGTAQDWNSWLTGSITYDGTYPRLTTVNLDGSNTITNVPVAPVKFLVEDLGDGWWSVDAVFKEYKL